MSRFKRMSDTIWHCEYHIVWTPKYRFRVLQRTPHSRNDFHRAGMGAAVSPYAPVFKVRTHRVVYAKTRAAL